MCWRNRKNVTGKRFRMFIVVNDDVYIKFKTNFTSESVSLHATYHQRVSRKLYFRF